MSDVSYTPSTTLCFTRLQDVAQLTDTDGSWTEFLPVGTDLGQHGKGRGLLLLVCVSLTIIGQPRNSVLIRRV